MCGDEEYESYGERRDARAVDFVQRRMGVWSGDEEEEGGEV